MPCFSYRFTVPNPSQSIEKSVASRIYGKGRGAVFTPNDFLDLGSRGSIDLSLHRLTDAGTIRRIARGLYHYPESHRLLGEVAPSIEAVAKALAAREQAKLQASGAYAANLLGLSEQVPAKVVFLTSGRARKVKLGQLMIELRPTTPRRVAAAGRTSVTRRVKTRPYLAGFARPLTTLEEAGLLDPRLRSPKRSAWDGLERFRP